jgi:PPP family 3-phenylpropionic acid transporter
MEIKVYLPEAKRSSHWNPFYCDLLVPPLFYHKLAVLMASLFCNYILAYLSGWCYHDGQSDCCPSALFCAPGSDHPAFILIRMPSNSRALYIGKALYFFMYAGLGIFFPFLNVYYKSIGLNGKQIGLIITLGPLIAIFAGPMWGLLGDKLGRLRLLLGIVILGSILSVLGLAMVTTFVTILGVVAVFNFFGCAIQPLVDSYNLSLLGEHRERYSEQRLWGTFGFLASSLFAGSVFEKVGLRYVFPGYALCLGLLLITLIWLPPTPTRMGRAVFKGFSQMLRQPVWIILSIAVVLVMIANNSWVNFLGITVKEMGAKDTLVGLMWSVGAFSEIPVMLFGTRLLRRLGAKRMMATGFLFYGIRLLLYAVMPVPEWVLGINIMQGLSFGFYWLGGVNYVGQITPDHLRATGMSMLASFYNIASVIAGPLIGSAFDSLGSSRLYLLAAVSAWTGLSIFVFGTLHLRRKNTLQAIEKTLS